MQLQLFIEHIQTFSDVVLTHITAKYQELVAAHSVNLLSKENIL